MKTNRGGLDCRDRLRKALAAHRNASIRAKVSIGFISLSERIRRQDGTAAVRHAGFTAEARTRKTGRVKSPRRWRPIELSLRVLLAGTMVLWAYRIMRTGFTRTGSRPWDHLLLMSVKAWTFVTYASCSVIPISLGLNRMTFALLMQRLEKKADSAKVKFAASTSSSNR